MMKEKDKQTEDTILEAAVEVFEEKGMTGARMQEIADKAGINKSLLHYYYRTKDKLFEKVFRKLSKRMFTKYIGNLAKENVSFEEKVYSFYNEHIGLLQKNPKLPLFLLNEINRNPELLDSIFDSDAISNTVDEMMKNIQTELSTDEYNDIDQVQLMVNIASLSVFPFIGRPIIERMLKSAGIDYNEFIEKRKTSAPEFIMNAIRANKKESK